MLHPFSRIGERAIMQAISSLSNPMFYKALDVLWLAARNTGQTRGEEWAKTPRSASTRAYTCQLRAFHLLIYCACQHERPWRRGAGHEQAPRSP